MNILSLFDGISTAQQALKNFGIKIDNYYASEIDRYAISITQKNFPNTIQLGSVVSLKVDFQPDLMVLGSPCQDLSIAKKDRKGLDGEKSGLFWEAIRIHKEVKPKFYLYENVSSMKKEWKEQMLKAIQEIDPNAYMIEINAALVSAQNRKRVFFTNIPNITQPEDKGILLKDILETGEIDREKSYCIDANYFKGGKIGGTHQSSTRNYIIRIGQIGKGGQGDRIYSPEGKSVNLSANGGGRGAKTGLYAIIPEATKRGYAIATEGQSVDMSFVGSKTRRGRVGNKVKNLMTSQNIGVFTKGIVRKLTPIECERLQTVPDNFTAKGINEKGEEVTISNSQRYKALGNGFCCAVIEHILSFARF